MIPDTRQRLEGALQDLTNYVVSIAMGKPAVHGLAAHILLWLACCACCQRVFTGRPHPQCSALCIPGRCGGRCCCHRGAEGCAGGNHGGADGAALMRRTLVVTVHWRYGHII